MLDEFRAGVEKAEKKFDEFEAFEIMEVSPEWFIDERSLELIEIYLFNKPFPQSAFPGTINQQKAIWIYSKLILDNILKDEFIL